LVSGLTFAPFLTARVTAARLAFKPLCGLALEGATPLSEIRELMRSKVDGVLFYGAMFTFLAPGTSDTLTELQLEFERVLLCAPKWHSRTCTRSSGGWLMTWGERLCYEALSFRAELWCCKQGMPVRTAWSAAQKFPGNTFAAASRHVLRQIGFPEIFAFDGCQDYINHGTPVLISYKQALQTFLEERSIS